jgi:Reverse transcriptase (RNA-dependent DNA polymerase)
MERFANVSENFRARDVHTFGCPMYVLQCSGVLQAKWATRARLAIYLGPSMNHARSVGLALSLSTGLVSPVFHAKYDDRFHTVVDSYGKYVTTSQWQEKCGFVKNDTRIMWVESPDTAPTNSPTIQVPHTIPAQEQDPDIQTVGDQQYITADNNDELPESNQDYTVTTPSQAPTTVPVDMNQPSNTVTTTTRSGRISRKPTYLDEYVTYETNVANTRQSSTITAFTDHVDPVAFILAGNQDNFYYHENLREADKDKFLQAMQEEITNHNENGNWIPVLRSTLSEGTKVIPSVWEMRRKRRLVDGKIHKWKARLNVDGSKQIKGVNFWETYATVAQWVSIRLVLCMVAVNKWPIKTFDFVQAFPQAPSEAELYIDVPRGCTIDDDNGKWAMKVVNNI